MVIVGFLVLVSPTSVSIDAMSHSHDEVSVFGSWGRHRPCSRRVASPADKRQVMTHPQVEFTPPDCEICNKEYFKLREGLAVIHRFLQQQQHESYEMQEKQIENNLKICQLEDEINTLKKSN